MIQLLWYFFSGSNSQVFFFLGGALIKIPLLMLVKNLQAYETVPDLIDLRQLGWDMCPQKRVPYSTGVFVIQIKGYSFTPSVVQSEASLLITYQK